MNDNMIDVFNLKRRIMKHVGKSTVQTYETHIPIGSSGSDKSDLYRVAAALGAEATPEGDLQMTCVQAMLLETVPLNVKLYPKK